MYKICCLLILVIVLLFGCSAQTTMETILDVDDYPVISQLRKLEIELPKEASVSTLQSEDGGRLYLCDDYTITVQTLDGGDLSRTLRQLTGFTKDNLTVMETEVDGIKRCSCVWSAAGEGGDYVGRALVLDDGKNHYTVSVMAEFSQAGNLSAKWKELFDSVKLTDID